jgi:hypothetical protein
MHMAVERFEITALVEVAACGAIGGLRAWHTRLSQPYLDRRSVTNSIEA